ncbi:proline racemase family protein [Bradyrhizobium sp. DOA9]|uniref:proline racemase family protein n=1 Tax=Bradyrhizobium sp. DOA9 TaxID=1126627 RepID=UPI00049989D3|nr:proline racemase family protein [Bradyrhizobium sp. DOA9]GAJ37780.1 proline racemase [Bradyrhizobium sp. DOA9]
MIGLSSSFSVIDTHTVGHPTRVILSGIPPLNGRDVLEKREDFSRRFDHLRGLLLHEPRGHAAMFGLVPVPSSKADYGAIFISSYSYLDMCGHGTIGLAKTLVSTGEIPSGRESFTLETPAGVITVGLIWDSSGRLKHVRLRNVPSYVGIEGLEVDSAQFGKIRVDIAYGGVWYALVEANHLGLRLRPENVTSLLQTGYKLKQEIAEAIKRHPDSVGATSPSVLFYEELSALEATHFLVLELNKFDRSPCGTGTSARLAQLAHRGRITADGVYTARNILGVPFEARIAERQPAAIVPEIQGIAHLVAQSTILLETDDPLSAGFLCK